MAKAPVASWQSRFSSFIANLRINSKHEAAAVGESGVELVLWESQQRVLDAIAEGLTNGVHIFYFLKSRQLGVSTVTLAILLFWVAIHPKMMAALVVDNDANRDVFRETLKNYVASFGPRYFGRAFGIEKDNKVFMQFSNGSRIDFLVAGKSKKTWGESRAYAAALLTEVAKYGSSEGLQSFMETMSEENPDRLYMFESPLALDTPIPTPSGWTTMGDVRAGDMVLAEDGRPVLVAGTSPIFINRKCYEVEFSNGERIVADEGHLWRVSEMRWKFNPQWRDRDVTTAELKSDCWHAINLAQPLQLEDVDLPVDPYLLGAWLGDGATAAPRLSASDGDIDEMRSILVSRGFDVGKVTRSENRCGMFQVLGQVEKFRAAGLLGNKHIPEVYLRASEVQRRALLAGLMDTDGSIDAKTLNCNFTSIYPHLIRQVAELLSTLGIKYRISEGSTAGKMRRFPGGNISKCVRAERILFNEAPDRSVFCLTRKRIVHERRASKVRAFTWRKSKRVTIRSITEVPSVPVKCIGVESASHLFLVGKTMIPTHNTAFGPNHWKEMWEDAGERPHTIRRVFVGWWANRLNRIKMSDPRFVEYGLKAPSPREAEKIALVEKLYGFRVKEEQLAWYRLRESSKATSKQDLDQNNPWTEGDAFVLSGASFFQIRLVVKNLEEARGHRYQAYRYLLGNTFWDSSVELIADESRRNEVELRVYEDPVPGARYVIGMDPSGGRSENADNHVISAWRCFADKLVQVAEYCDNKAGTKQAAWVLAHFAGVYRNCLLNIELTGGHGLQVMDQFETLKRELRSPEYQAQMGVAKGHYWLDFTAHARWYLYHRPDSPGAGFAYNFMTTGRTKFSMMNGFRDAHTTEMLVIRSYHLAREMGDVTLEGYDIKAPGKLHDDRVFAAALANETWAKWVRPYMISRGETYDRLIREEEGVAPTRETVVNQLVFAALNRTLPQEPKPRDFLSERGLR